VDRDDIQRMISKLGININKDEAFVLMLSADENCDGGLDIEEFHELIYSNNDAFNVDLSKIPVSASDNQMNELKKNLNQNIVKQRQEKAMSQVKLFVQKNLHNIAMDLLDIDEERTFKVDKADM